LTETGNGLKLLLEKIKPLPPTSEPHEPSWQQLRLVTRTRNRRYREAVLEQLRQVLQLMERDLWYTRHFKTCRRCQVELSLSITRYAGRGAPWFLNIEAELGWPEIYKEHEVYKDAPRPWDYDMGNYWNGENVEEATRFIVDRCGWAEEKIREAAASATVYLEQLVEWSLDGSPPAHDEFTIYLY